MLTEQKITWGNAHYLWNDFKLGTEYQQYLFDVYGITVENGGRVIWSHVFNVVEVTISPIVPGAFDETGGIFRKEKKKEKKKIKLIFIMGDVEKTEIKEIKSIPSAAITDIKNHIEEQLQTKVTLKDVQVIKG
jgi:hypothetical protein